MSDQIFYNKPSDEPSQNNNALLWIVLASIAVIILLFAIFNSNGNQSSEMPTPNPQETQIPQDPQNTQIPQNPQETQIPQNPQSTQIPQPTTVPTSTDNL